MIRDEARKNGSAKMGIQYLIVAARASILLIPFVIAQSATESYAQGNQNRPINQPQPNDRLMAIESSIKDLQQRHAMSDAQAAYLKELADKIEGDYPLETSYQASGKSRLLSQAIAL